MSEYQYYEFLAVDRPLTDKEMRELRAVSTRARITSMSFVNEYNWGDFKGDPNRWMEKYFDAFLYCANWGTNILKLRIPARLLEGDTALQYCAGESASVKKSKDYLVLSFDSEDEEGGWEENDISLSALVPLRSELMHGDLRALYLGWLLCAQNGELDDEEIEPPVPPGLDKLSASLASLVEFLRIEANILHAASLTSAPLKANKPDREEILSWVEKLPANDKDVFLTEMVIGNNLTLAVQLQQRFLESRRANQHQSTECMKRRTVGEILAAADEYAKERQRIAAEKAAREKERRDRETAKARVKYLDEIAEREPNLWNEVGTLIATKQPKNFDTAVRLLIDLRDLSIRNQTMNEFCSRIEDLKIAHSRKPSLIERMRRAGLCAQGNPGEKTGRNIVPGGDR